MATKVTMEALSPTMEEGRLVKWLKSEGDEVKNGEVVAEVETDKAVMELSARGQGVLRKIVIGEGESAPVGALLAVIAGADEDISSLVESRQPSAPAAEKEGKQKPSEGEEPPERQAASPDDRQPPPDRRAASSEGKAATEGAGTAPAARRQPAAHAPARGSEQRDEAPAPGDGEAPAAREGERVRSSPLARRLAAESGIDIAALSGSGPGGRIIKRDILQAEQDGAGKAAAAPRTREDDFEDVALTQIRKTIARRLVESIGPIPTFYLTAEFDLERVAEMRGAMAELGDEYKVSFNDIMMKAIATALSQHPECNAHWLGDRVRQFYRVHLGMAVATDDGLIVPVIFDADAKSMGVIAREARELAKRARERKLKPEEYTGSTFSVSNLGMFGIDHFTAIINPPEAGIIAIGAIEERPVRGRDAVEFRKRMRITMSCDHRVIDGAVGARFLQTLRRLIENPLMLVY